MSESYHRDLIAIIRRTIRDTLVTWRPDLRQTTGSLPPTQLPPAGGSGGSGTRGGVVLSDDDPLAVSATAADPGTSDDASRADHVHFGSSEPSDGDKGDITVSGGGTVWTIDAGVVSVAQLSFDPATQAELDSEATTRAAADTALAAPQYLTLALSSTLANERRLVAGSGISITDGGANADATIATTAGVAVLDDLTDVIISSPVAADRLRYDGSVWRTSALIWQPLTNGDPTSPELIFAGGDVIMVEV